MPNKLALIPDDIRNAANADLAADMARRSVLRERFEKEVRCADAVKAFMEATDALWSAHPNKALPLINAVHQTLLDAYQALAEGGRLEPWKHIDHEITFERFRALGFRVMSKSSYDWARILHDKSCTGQLPKALLKETWAMAPLRDAIRWLRIFIVGLSGEGAVLPRMQERAPFADPAPPGPTEAQSLQPVPDLKNGVVEQKPASHSTHRLRFDVETLTITLDGVDHRIADPKKYQIFKTIAEAGRQITNSEIQKKVSGVRGQKAIRRHLQALSPELRATIKTTTAGHWLVLPRKTKIANCAQDRP